MSLDALISIIIPVFNTPEAYLRRCVKSVLDQTHVNIELLLVDDGSEDSCSAVLDQIAASDQRVKLIRQKNAGVSAARNVALSAVSGEYVMFVDADDELARTDVLQLAIETAVHTEADIVFGCVEYCFAEESFVKRFEFEERLRVYSGNRASREIQEFFLSHSSLNGVSIPTGTTRGPCAKLFRRACLAGIAFDEGIRVGEDLVFVMEACANASVFCFVDECWYKYYQYASSSIHSVLLDDCERECDPVRAHVPDESLANAFGSYKFHRYLDMAIKAADEYPVHVLAEQLTSAKFDEVARGFNDKPYRLPKWEQLCLSLGRSGNMFVLAVALKFGQFLLKRNKKQLIR